MLDALPLEPKPGCPDGRLSKKLNPPNPTHQTTRNDQMKRISLPNQTAKKKNKAQYTVTMRSSPPQPTTFSISIIRSFLILFVSGCEPRARIDNGTMYWFLTSLDRRGGCKIHAINPHRSNQFQQRQHRALTLWTLLIADRSSFNVILF